MKLFKNTNFFGDNIDLSTLFVGDIMYDERLRWCEQILMKDIDDELACAHTSYSDMAENLLELLGE